MRFKKKKKIVTRQTPQAASLLASTSESELNGIAMEEGVREKLVAMKVVP